MIYVGIDYHKKYSFATKMDESGKILEQQRFNNDSESIQKFVKTLPSDSKIVLEATGGWYYFYEQIENQVTDIVLAHPLRTRAIAEARIKTDKIDSKILAHLLRTDLIPTAYIPKQEIRDIREILRYRLSLVMNQTMLKNRIHAILIKNGINFPFSDLLLKKAQTFLNHLEIREYYQKEIVGYLALLNQFKVELQKINHDIEKISIEREDARLLTSIPGIGYYSALLLISEIGDISRFPSPGQLCSYAGLVPSVHSSGDKTYNGRITKQGSKYIRWILVEAVNNVIKKSHHLQAMFERICRKHGSSTARIAVARELLKIIFNMLQDKRAFFVDLPGRLVTIHDLSIDRPTN